MGRGQRAIRGRRMTRRPPRQGAETTTTSETITRLVVLASGWVAIGLGLIGGAFGDDDTLMEAMAVFGCGVLFLALSQIAAALRAKEQKHGD